MSQINEQNSFDATVYQYDVTDKVLGGAGGTANAPVQNLANRTRWLYNQVQALLQAGYTTLAAVQAYASGTFQPLLGFTPVEQSGGANQSGNKVYIGLDNAGDVAGPHLRAQVDSTDLGPLALLSDVALSGSRDVGFNASGTWTVPAGVFVFRVKKLYAGGGGGGFGNYGGGGGGGGGGYAAGAFAVTPGQVVTIIVGSAGSGGTSGAAASAGGASSVAIGNTVLCSATGGSGGANGTANGIGAGGTPGSGSGTPDVSYGSVGYQGSATSSDIQSGSGGGTYGYQGGPGILLASGNNGPGNNAQTGCGGSGGIGTGTGGNGGAGFVLFEY